MKPPSQELGALCFGEWALASAMRAAAGGEEGAFQTMYSSHFQSKSYILPPWKSLCFNCQSLHLTGTEIIRLASPGVNSTELSRFSSGSPALQSFLLAASQGHLAWPSEEGQGEGMAKGAGTVCKLVPRDCLAWKPRGKSSLCLKNWPAVAGWNQRGASPRENWSLSQKEVISLDTLWKQYLFSTFIYGILVESLREKLNNPAKHFAWSIF